jgi:hypothetical protein
MYMDMDIKTAIMEMDRFEIVKNYLERFIPDSKWDCSDPEYIGKIELPLGFVLTKIKTLRPNLDFFTFTNGNGTLYFTAHVASGWDSVRLTNYCIVRNNIADFEYPLMEMAMY